MVQRCRLSDLEEQLRSSEGKLDQLGQSERAFRVLVLEHWPMCGYV